jgi:hypothetical protein
MTVAHSITSSARASSVGHKSPPSVRFGEGVLHERRIHSDLGEIIAGAVQSFERISTTNMRSGTFVLFCAAATASK